MGQIKWYKRDPSAALNGMMELSLEERGAYNTILDLIYSRDGNLVDDDRFIAGWLRVDVRIWKRIKTSLIERGKLYVDGELLRNEKADVVVLEALSRVGSARDAGLASARSKASKSTSSSRKNSNLASTPVETGDATGVSTNQNQIQKEEEAKASPSRRASKAKPETKSRMTADWVPGPLPDNVQTLVDLWPPGRLDREFNQFRDYWLDRPDRRPGWDRTFHNRIRDIHDRVMREASYGNRSANDRRNPTGGYEPDRRDGFVRALDRDLGLYDG